MLSAEDNLGSGKTPDHNDLLENFSFSGKLPGLGDKSEIYSLESPLRVSENLNNYSSRHYSHYILPNIEIEPEHGIDKKIYHRERIYKMDFPQKLSQTFCLDAEPEQHDSQEAPLSPSFGKVSPRLKLIND